tara:strand:+ start:1584 stop:1691 length:108 start_codon:yes stop_codon:yes gene_type:complete
MKPLDCALFVLEITDPAVLAAYEEVLELWITYGGD